MDEKTDELARNAARNTLADIANRRIEEDALAYNIHRYIADSVVNTHTVTWERVVNEHGKAVRRYVLRGAWEVDPEAVKP